MFTQLRRQSEGSSISRAAITNTFCQVTTVCANIEGVFYNPICNSIILRNEDLFFIPLFTNFLLRKNLPQRQNKGEQYNLNSLEENNQPSCAIRATKTGVMSTSLSQHYYQPVWRDEDLRTITSPALILSEQILQGKEQLCVCVQNVCVRVREWVAAKCMPMPVKKNSVN